MRGSSWSGVGALVSAFLLAACGSDPSVTTTSTGGAASSTGSGNGGAGGAGTTGSGDTGVGGIGFGGSGSGVGGSGGIDTCAGSTSQAELIPLDMYIMLDKSGSMTDKTGAKGQGQTKWDAVTQALQSFFADPQSAGLGVGLQYFPLTAPGAPASCASSADCGQYGPCFLKVCNGDTNIICNTNADCAGGVGPCTAIGQCKNDPSTYCLPVGATCNGNKGACVQLSKSVCVNTDSCSAADYGAPAVPVATLNGAAAALNASIKATTPEGATPTAAALQGAIDYAHGYAAANPTHKVVAVLATDGLPTECSPTDAAGIAQIAAAGLAGAPGVPTFVIGVFAGNDMTAKATLDQIAAAGGTQQAFIVDVNQNVNQAFLDALNAIRGSKLACEYQIPNPPPGETLDYAKVNVEHTPAGAMKPETIYYVGSAAGCDPMTGGWYYDVDPQMGKPTKILICAETCGAFGLGGQVDIRLGCATIEPPPK